MRRTTIGETIRTFTADGETVGWTFVLTGNGPDDALFNIVGNELRVAAAYVPPGPKSVQVHMSKVGEPQVISNDPFTIQDYGIGLDSTKALNLPGNVLPAWDANSEIYLTFFPDAAAGFGIWSSSVNAGANAIEVSADGTVQAFQLNGASPATQLAASAPGLVVANRWNELSIINNGSNQTIFRVNGVVVHAATTNKLQNQGADVISILSQVTATKTVVCSNLKIKINNVYYIAEELEVDAGVLTTTGSPTFNILK